MSVASDQRTLSFGLFVSTRPDVKKEAVLPPGRITDGKLEGINPQAIVGCAIVWYSSSSHHPSKGDPKLEKKGAYSWLKSPRRQA
jgi:Ni,Fe-hydrogenase I large subunit